MIGGECTYYLKDGFTYGNQIMDYKAIINVFETSYSVQQLRRCLDVLDVIPLAATDEGGNFTLEEVDDLFTLDYCSGG